MCEETHGNNEGKKRSHLRELSVILAKAGILLRKGVILAEAGILLRKRVILAEAGILLRVAMIYGIPVFTGMTRW
jgi:hypothetical protein